MIDLWRALRGETTSDDVRVFMRTFGRVLMKTAVVVGVGAAGCTTSLRSNFPDVQEEARASIELTQKYAALRDQLPEGAQSICNDGWVSYSSGSGTCSWHGGVSRDLDDNIQLINLMADAPRAKEERVLRMTWTEYHAD